MRDHDDDERRGGGGIMMLKLSEVEGYLIMKMNQI
jgi:hypothetical protein